MANTSTATPSLFALGLEAQELQSQIANLAELLDSEDSATQAQAVTDLEALLEVESSNQEALLKKADAYCWVRDQLKAQATFRKEQSKRLSELAAADERRAAKLVESLILVLTALQPSATKFSLPTHELTSRRVEAVEIENEEDLSPDLLTVKTTTAPDKTAIKAAIKAGKEVPGALLVSRRSWSIK